MCRRPEDDKSLRDKLVESWDGHSYYDRLLQMSQGEKECGGSTEAAAAAAAAGGDGNAQPHATTKRPPSPGMAQQRQLNELASDLQSLKVSARQGASAAGVAAPTEKKREAELPAEAAPASKFQRANKAQRAAAAAAPAPAAAAAATLAANDSQGQQAAAAEACATVSGASEAEHKLRAELAAAYEMLNAALADKGKLEGRLKAAKRDLADERDARAAAVEEAEAAKGALQVCGTSVVSKHADGWVEMWLGLHGVFQFLLPTPSPFPTPSPRQPCPHPPPPQEEIKSRKAAEKKVKDLGRELAEAKKRAAEATEGSARSVAGAVDRLAELEARCGGALEAQLAAVLKAANTLQKEVAVVKADAHAAGELLRGGSGSENGGSRSAVKAPSRQGWR